VEGQDIAFAGWTGGAFQNAGVTYSEGVWQFDRLASYLYQPGIEGACPRFHMGQLTIDKTAVAVDQLQYSIPSRHLPQATETLHRLFPGSFSTQLTDWMAVCKSSGSLIGTVNFKNGADWWVNGQVTDDTYHWLKIDHPVRNLAFSADREEVRAAMQYRYVDAEHGLHATYQVATGGGQVKLFDLPKELIATSPISYVAWAEKVPDEKFCTVDWHTDEELGFVVDSAEGEVAGLQLALTRDEGADESQFLRLGGDLILEWPIASCLFDKQFRENCTDIGLSGTYLFKGDWKVAREGVVQPHFYGEIIGEDCGLRGVYFDQGVCQVELEPESIVVKNMDATDPAGRLSIPNALFSIEEEQWQMDVPVLYLRGCNPSLIQWIGESRGEGSKPLRVDLFELRDLTGVVADAKSWCGRGHMEFSNPLRRSTQNTIFAIPADIIARIGLDLDVMTPVSGTVRYHLEQRKFYLDEFVDVFSEGRISKFYLPNGYNSWIDLDGGLNVTVRMKQYNIIFKLAELFTFTLQGSLSKPTYTAQKQPTKGEETSEEQTFEEFQSGRG
jgi:hypothetical protein